MTLIELLLIFHRQFGHLWHPGPRTQPHTEVIAWQPKKLATSGTSFTFSSLTSVHHFSVMDSRDSREGYKLLHTNGMTFFEQNVLNLANFTAACRAIVD